MEIRRACIVSRCDMSLDLCCTRAICCLAETESKSIFTAPLAEVANAGQKYINRVE